MNKYTVHIHFAFSILMKKISVIKAPKDIVKDENLIWENKLLNKS